VAASAEAGADLEVDDGERGLEATEGARKYAEAIVATVREPPLVLDASLRVVKANRSFYDTFGVSPAETEKRLIYDLGDRQWNQCVFLPTQSVPSQSRTSDHSSPRGAQIWVSRLREGRGAHSDR
jgi:PAS domain-containing protein